MYSGVFTAHKNSLLTIGDVAGGGGMEVLLPKAGIVSTRIQGTLNHRTGVDSGLQKL